MSPMQAAARAEQDQPWTGSLRISEVVGTSSRGPQRSQDSPFAIARRDAWLHIQAGWRWLESKRAHQLASRRLHVAETISLGDKRSVSIVQVDGAQYLIGCSSSSVQLLAVLGTGDGKSIEIANAGSAS